MARRKNQKIREIATSQVEEVFGQYAHAHAEHKEITAQMEQEITQVRERYAARLEKQKGVMDERYAELQLWAETNDDKFEKRRSLPFAHGKLGFRTGTPKAKTRRGFTWAAALKLIKEFIPEYIVVKEQPNKERLIQDREQLDKKGLLEKVGVDVVQDVTFFVEVKEEEAATA